MALSTRNKGAIDPQDIICLQGLTLDDENDILATAIDYPPGTNSLLNTALPPVAGPVRTPLLHITLVCMYDIHGLLSPGRESVTITTPQSQRTIQASGWSPEIDAFLRACFTETFQVVCNRTPGSTLWMGDQMHHLSNVADSIEAIVTYVNKSLAFSDKQEALEFVQRVSESLDNLWHGMNICENPQDPVHVSLNLKILNGLLLLSYQMDQCAIATSCPDTTRTHILKIRKNIANHAWELIFRKQDVGALFAFIAGEYDNSVSPDERHSKYWAGGETILFIHTLGPHQEWNVYMEIILSNHGKGGTLWYLYSQAESLACTVLTLGSILVLVGPGACTTPVDSRTTMPLGCMVHGQFLTKVSDFLKLCVEQVGTYNEHSTSRFPHVRKLMQFGLVIFRWCFLLTRNYMTDSLDKLVKQLFKYYSEKGMLGLFTSTPTRSLPRFLEHDFAPDCLLPENADTDFHLFLKLTALTLAQRPDANCDLEHERKLELRKRSLLFLLLPNKGSDLGKDRRVQVEEDTEILVDDLAGISNRYTLFATLYHYAPITYKPEISQIRDYINFGSAHDEVRKVILRCWTSLVKSVLAQPTHHAALSELGHWILSMFLSISDKLSTIPTNDNSRHADRNVRAEYHMHRTNQKVALERLEHIASAYAAAIELCPAENQASSLFIHQELPSLLLLCYHDRVRPDSMVARILDLLTCYIKKGLSKELESLQSFRRDVRGILEDQLNQTRILDEKLLISITEIWYALGMVMVRKGHLQWDQFLSPWSSMSFYQVANTRNGNRCQVLLMSKIAVDRDVILVEPYPFVNLLLRSILMPSGMLSFEHCLINQLMKSVPDAFAMHTLQKKITNELGGLLLDKYDVINNQFMIVDHILQFAKSVHASPDPSMPGYITRQQWDVLMKMVPSTINKAREDFVTPTPQWTLFVQKVLFRLSLYSGTGLDLDSWLPDPGDSDWKSCTFKLPRLFLHLPCSVRTNQNDDGDLVKVFRSAVEAACINNEQWQLSERLGALFSASDLSYIDEDGTYLLDISRQLDFMKVVFPIYIEEALDPGHATMFLAAPVLDTATEILRKLEVRVDLQDRERMECYAELIHLMMAAAAKAMERYILPLNDHRGWQAMAVRRFLDLCALGAGRWAYLHQLFPASANVLAIQANIQTYALYAYEYARDALRHDRHRHSVSDSTNGGPETRFPEHLLALRSCAYSDLMSIREDWKLVWSGGLPQWELHRGASAPVLKQESAVVPHGTLKQELEGALERLAGVLTLLGVLEEEL